MFHALFSVGYFLILIAATVIGMLIKLDNLRLDRMAAECRKKHKGDNAEVLKAICDWRIQFHQ